MNHLKPALLVLIGICIMTWLMGRGSTPHLRHGLPFLFSTLFWISGALSMVLAAMVVFGRKQSVTDQERPSIQSRSLNRRQSFRIEYPTELRPTLIIEASDVKLEHQVELPVIDLSEDGIRFVDDGQLMGANELAGQLRFNSGETVAISGTVVRRTDQHICLCLQHGLTWATLLEEQRVLIRRLNESAE